jgi:hypothetical protein
VRLTAVEVAIGVQQRRRGGHTAVLTPLWWSRRLNVARLTTLIRRRLGGSLVSVSAQLAVDLYQAVGGRAA